MHVLIVDDEPLAQIALTNILAGRREVEGFETANDAVEALDKLMHQSFDVLLLDLSMPEVSGIQLLDQLTAHGRLLPSVVFVTAYQKHVLAAFEKHAVEYVLKPFSNERIEEALDTVFRRSAGRASCQVGWRLFRSCKDSLSERARRSRLKPTEKSCSLRRMM